MGFLDRIFGKKRAANAGATAALARSQPLTDSTATTETPPCPHTALVPRWDSVADMGNEAKVTSYTCESCQQHFTAAEGRRLRQTEAERVQRELATPDQG